MCCYWGNKMKIRKSELKEVIREVIDASETRLDEAVPASARGAKFKNYKGPQAKKEVHKDLLDAFRTIMAVKRFVDVQQDKKARHISKTLSRLAATISLKVVDSIDALKDNE